MTDPADMTDAELRAAWLRTDGEVGDPVADALLAEMERRGIYEHFSETEVLPPGV